MVNKKSENKYFIPLIIVGVMFFIMGFGIGISGFLTPALKDAFHLTTGQSYLVTAAIFSAFVIFGRPAGWVIKKTGYRKAITLSFIIMALGMLLFIPSSNMVSFPMFLLALFIGGVGNTLLQASVNPYVTILGPQNSAATRMCFMGIMNKLSWWVAPVFLGLFINLKDVHISDIILPFYIVTAILVILAILVYFSPLPEVKAEGEEEDELNTANNTNQNKTIWQYPHLLLGVLALFFYVGVETLPMVSIIDFAKATFGKAVDAGQYAVYVPSGLIIGYVFGVIAIPKYLSQTRALILFAILGVISSFLLVFLSPNYAFYALALISFANSLMWPSIWPLAIADLGKLTKQGSSILVMGIVGGAVIPFIFGSLIDLLKGSSETVQVSNYQHAYWVFVPCYLFILYFASIGHKIRKKNIS